MTGQRGGGKEKNAGDTRKSLFSFHLGKGLEENLKERKSQVFSGPLPLLMHGKGQISTPLLLVLQISNEKEEKIIKGNCKEETMKTRQRNDAE